LLPVVQVMLLVTHDLVVLVRLARNQDEVTGTREPDSERDRRPAVRLDEIAPTMLAERAEAGLHDPGLDRVEDTPRVLGAGIVRGEDHDVAQAGRGLSHQRALARVTIAATAEDGDQAAGGQR